MRVWKSISIKDDNVTPNIHPARCFNARVFFSAYANRTSIMQSDVISRKGKAAFSVSSCISSTWHPHLHGNEGSAFCIIFLSGILISMEAFSVSSSCLVASSPWKRRKPFLYRLPVVVAPGSLLVQLLPSLVAGRVVLHTLPLLLTLRHARLPRHPLWCASLPRCHTWKTTTTHW